LLEYLVGGRIPEWTSPIREERSRKTSAMAVRKLDIPASASSECSSVVSMFAWLRRITISLSLGVPGVPDASTLASLLSKDDLELSGDPSLMF
jgi:hypothetical protein